MHTLNKNTTELLFNFFLNNLSDWGIFIDGPTPAVSHQLVVLHNVHVTVVIVLIESVKTPLMANQPAGAFFFVAATVVLFSVKVTSYAIHVTFLDVSDEVGPSPPTFNRLIPSFGVLLKRQT